MFEIVIVIVVGHASLKLFVARSLHCAKVTVFFSPSDVGPRSNFLRTHPPTMLSRVVDAIDIFCPSSHRWTPVVVVVANYCCFLHLLTLFSRLVLMPSPPIQPKSKEGQDTRTDEQHSHRRGGKNHAIALTALLTRKPHKKG